MDEKPQAKGGDARAAALSEEQRKEIAKRAAAARWGDEEAAQAEPAQLADDLRLGEIVIPCAVLQDGTRVLSERGISKALGRTRSGSHWQKKREQGAELPLYLTAGNIKPFISNELIMAPCRLLRQRRQARRVWHNPAYGLAQKDYTKRKIGLDS